jgi:hypothetical protein
MSSYAMKCFECGDPLYPNDPECWIYTIKIHRGGSTFAVKDFCSMYCINQYAKLKKTKTPGELLKTWT